MPAVRISRRRVELIVIPVVAAFCMAFIIGAIVLDRDSGPCPQANWNNQISLSLTGNLRGTTSATAVTACSGAKCVPSSPAFASIYQGDTRILTHQEDGTWIMTLGPQPPSVVTFHVFDDAGAVLASQTSSLNWTRVSGDERCGGRMAKISVVMDMP